MSRNRLPNYREAITIPPVAHPTPGSTVEYTVKIGFNEEGKPLELFINCNKLTTAMDTAGREIATLVSIALQHGATLEELAAAMPREEDPNDKFVAKAQGREPNLIPQGAAGAVLDAVIAELAWLKSVGSAA